MTTMYWQPGPHDDGYTFRIHWKNVKGRFTAYVARKYIEGNEFPNWIYNEYADIMREAKTRYMFV